METDTSIVVRYWIATDHPSDYPDLEGIGEFRRELANDYVSVVRGRPSGAGGAVHILVDIVSNLRLSDLAQIIAGGAAYDLVKEGARSFILRPFIRAYAALKERNRDRKLDLRELRIEFQDCLLVIHEVSMDTNVDSLSMILPALAKHYDRLALATGQRPSEIHVPVVEDPDTERPCRFRVIAHVDETINDKGSKDYLAYWGVVYDRPPALKVYGVDQASLLHERFNTVEDYWQDLSRRINEKMKARNNDK
jgi:hypothetical protein